VDILTISRSSFFSTLHALRSTLFRLVREKIPFFVLVALTSAVTFVVQKEKAAFKDFDAWYTPRQEILKADATANWLNQARAATFTRSFGALTEFVFSSAEHTIFLRIITPDYFVALVLGPRALLGKARFLLNLAQGELASQKPQIRNAGAIASLVFELETYCVNG